MMRKDLLSAVIRSALAFTALAALLVGLPVALAVLAGWPLPSAVPTLAQVRDSLNGPSITDAMLVKGIAVICWLAWAQLVACAVVETHAWARGRVAVHLPLAGALQPVVRQLVLSVVFLAGALRSPVAATVPLRAVPTIELMPIHAVADTSTDAAPEHAGVATSAPEAPFPTCVVRPRDSLWSLSEDHLGDGYRWRELFELNRGVVQADGRSLQESNLIRPGWTLRFPADATGLAEPLVETSAPPPAMSPPMALPTPVPQEAPPVSSEAPAAASPSDQATPATTAITQAASAPDSVSAQQAPAAAEDDDQSGLPIPTSVAGLGLMAAGVVVTLDRLRRVQQRRRRDGHMIPVPTGPAAEAERMLRTAAANSQADRLDEALRAFSAQLSRTEAGPIPAIEAVSVAPDSVEILLSGPAHAPSRPFDVTAGGRSWVLPAAADVADVATKRSAPAPALVTIGTVDGRQILVDLEAHPRTALIGEASEALFAALVLELCTSRWADTLHLVLAGQPPSGAGAYERLRVVASVEEALEEVEAESVALTSELAASRHGSTFSARLAETADGWVPTVVLVTDPTDPALDRLLLVASENHGLAVVVLGHRNGDVDRTITVERGAVRVTPPGLDLAAPAITTEDAATIGAVIDLATSDEAGEVVVLDAPPSPTGATVDEVTPPGPEIDVQILGSPEVVGGKTPIDRRKSKELVVYLALHPRGVDEGRLKTALWPDQVPSPGSFNQTMSRARMCLGRDANDEHHLPHVADGLYRLGPAVDTDFRRLEQAFAAATTDGTEATMGRLADALGMVRGMPFEGAGAGYEWAHTEGLLARIEAIAADAALLLAEWHLDRRDTAKAMWAASQGLLASPGDERLFRIRMRAHDQAGNPAGVESVMTELCRVVEALEPFDDLHPETVALYDELSRRRRRTG
jgi:DNA-binding SARP family transcriptional activator